MIKLELTEREVRLALFELKLAYMKAQPNSYIEKSIDRINRKITKQYKA